MKPAASIAALILLLSVARPAAFARQAVYPYAESRAGGAFHPNAKATIADPAEEAYDMKYVKFNISLTNTSTAISGDVTMRAVVTALSMSSYVFELDAQLSIDSCKINGSLRTVATSGDVRTVVLPATITSGTSFTAQVFYHGQPSGIGGNVAGLNNQLDTRWHTTTTYTFGEPYTASGWWPCKMVLRDKIDSADIWITVADTLKAGSNGILQAVTPLPGNRLRYEWKTRYPIDYYLLSAAVGNYTDYSYYAHYSGSSDSTLVQNYVYNIPGVLNSYQPILDSMGKVMDYFSGIFGRYPFWKEKYGHCFTAFPGGEEHQTISTINSVFFSSIGVLTHELAHQWWGDNITCGSYTDIWLNEGFAEYSEHLATEHFAGPSFAAQEISGYHESVIKGDNGSLYVDDTTSMSGILNGSVYTKGASVLHMLRYLAGNDTTFFRMLRTYRALYEGGVAYTPDFKAVAEAVYGRSLDSFFRQWVYGEGCPRYSATINQRGDFTALQLSQTSSTPFNFPVEVRCSGSLGDTVVTVPMNGPTGLITFRWSKPLETVIIDPADWIPNRDGFFTVWDSSLAVSNGAVQNTIAVAPNPARSEWQLYHIPTGSAACLTDIYGRILMRFTATSSQLSIPAEALPTGLYLLHLQDAGRRNNEVLRLMRE